MELPSVDSTTIWITLKLAFYTTVILLLVATPLAWWLATTRNRLKPALSALVAMPLVLPPTVLGFYLLILMGPQGAVGQITQALGLGLLPFTFPGLVVASVIYSLPFAVQPIQGAFEQLGRRPLEAAATLRASPLDRFFTIVLPLARPGILSATVLTFAHTVGEFGVVLMLGGNISGETRVLSVAIYDHVETLEYQQAHLLSAGLILFSFVVLLLLQRFNGKRRWQPL
ncbi:MAG: molybdate ABC transporter permease subunit [Pseudomonadota bacterium]|nr:molybdate ABC transporter permease subunit [Pseudomonadota bacterium]